MSIRDATAADLSAIVAIYNAAIPGRLATADTEPITIESRVAWLSAHAPTTHPLWVWQDAVGTIGGWLSFQPFYGRPAYRGTAELSVYVAPTHQRQGGARRLVDRAVRHSPTLGITTLLGFIFGHNEASLALFAGFGFEQWALLPCVAVLDGVERDLVILGHRVAAVASA